ncbi:MAG: cyclic nucleotide-binding domain-containing protein [Betaproteobacteria bacterium]
MIDDATLVAVDLDAAEHGATLIELCRTRFPDVPMIALAEVIDESSIPTIMNAGGAWACMPKSYSDEQTIGVLRIALDRATASPKSDIVAMDSLFGVLGCANGRWHGKHRYGLTTRQIEIVSLRYEGLSNVQVAERLGINAGTVMVQMSLIYRKLGAANFKQAVRFLWGVDRCAKAALARLEDSSSDLGWLMSQMTEQRYAREDVLFRKNAPIPGLYFIQEGRVFVPEIRTRLGEGHVFGEIGIFPPQQTVTFSAICDRECRLLHLTTNQAKRLYMENAEFAHHSMQLIARRLSHVKMPMW